MDSNPYESPKSSRSERSPNRRAHFRGPGRTLPLLIILLIVLSVVLYYLGIMLVFAADNPQPEKARLYGNAGEALILAAGAMFFSAITLAGYLIYKMWRGYRSE